MTELKACPFCGSKAEYREDKDRQYRYHKELVVGCTNSHCFCRYRKSIGIGPSEDLIKIEMNRMVEKWNKRMIETQESEEVWEN